MLNVASLRIERVGRDFRIWSGRPRLLAFVFEVGQDEPVGAIVGDVPGADDPETVWFVDDSGRGEQLDGTWDASAIAAPPDIEVRPVPEQFRLQPDGSQAIAILWQRAAASMEPGPVGAILVADGVAIVETRAGRFPIARIEPDGYPPEPSEN
mgnify:CR=1 FL=1